MSSKRTLIWILAEAAALSAIYFFLLAAWGFPGSLEKFLFYAPDAREYRDFGMWLFGDGGYCSDTRPYLYPLLLQGLLKLGGPYLFWFFQYALYLGAGLLCSRIARSSTGSRIAGVVVLAVYGLNFSAAHLTLHALTETISLFLIVLSIYFFMSSARKRNDYIALLCLCLLAAVKPLFLYPPLLLLLFLAWRDRRLLLLEWKRGALMLASLGVLLVQPLLMHSCSENFSFSKIGIITLRNYYFQKLYANVNEIPYSLDTGPDSAALARIKPVSDSASMGEIAEFSLQHFPQAAKLHLGVMHDNIIAFPALMDTATGKRPLADFTYKGTQLYIYPHALALLCVIYLAFRKRLCRLPRGWGMSYALVLYILFASGISFWQGDRLTIISLAGWLAIYPVLFQACFKKQAPRPGS